MCHSHTFDRRSLLRAGAGVVTVGALATFSPAAAGAVQTKTFRGEFTSPATPDWHYLPIKVPGGVREIEVSYDFEPDRHGGRLQLQRGRHRDLRPVRPRPGQRQGIPRMVRWRPTQLPALPRVGDARLPRGPDHGRGLEHRARSLRDRPARHEMGGHRHPPLRRPRAAVRRHTGSGVGAGDGSGLVPRRPAPAHRPLRREADAAGDDRSRPRGRARLHRLLRPQHQLGVVHLGAAHATGLPGHQRRGGHDPEWTLAGHRPPGRDLDRLALPRGG